MGIFTNFPRVKVDVEKDLECLVPLRGEVSGSVPRFFLSCGKRTHGLSLRFHHFIKFTGLYCFSLAIVVASSCPG